MTWRDQTNWQASPLLLRLCTAVSRLPFSGDEVLSSHFFSCQVAILQEELEAKELEVTRLKEETLSQKEDTQDAPSPAPAPVEEGDGAGNDLKPASDPLQVKLES